MAIDKEKKIAKTAIFSKEIYRELEKEAHKNKRSVSAQIAYACEQYLAAKKEGILK